MANLQNLQILTGELAAIGTAVFFAISATLFAKAGRQVGASVVNRSRLLVAALIAIAIYWVSRGEPIPAGLSHTAWVWLGASGVIGLALGDDLLFRAYVSIGPALSMLVFALVPAIATALGWIFLGETLSGREISGIAVTLFGVAWVVTARRQEAAQSGRHDSHGHGRGILFALGGAFGQALGLVTAKVGLNEGASPQAANCIRLLAAAVAVWLVTAFSGRARQTLQTWAHNRRASALTVAGALAGPIAGVWLSLVAINRAPVGVASTLMSLTPLFLLPIGRLVFQEPITFRALAGTLLAIAGVAILLQ